MGVVGGDDGRGGGGGGGACKPGADSVLRIMQCCELHCTLSLREMSLSAIRQPAAFLLVCIISAPICRLHVEL